MDRPHRILRLLVPALMACVVLTTGTAGAATERPDEQASADAVAAGLQRIEDIASNSAEAVAAGDGKAEDLHAGIEPVWEKIEGTVRANDSAAYAALEDNFTLLKIAAKSEDPARASTASENLSTAVKGYLAKHPGDAAAGAAAPSAGSRSAAAAAESAGTAPQSPDNLPRTGSMSSRLGALAGAALGLGGLALIGGARKRTRRPS
jgi:LPXTG-motif cell wall-anchored protein